MREPRIAVAALGFALIAGAAIWIIQAAVPGLGSNLAQGGYLGGVLARGLTNPYQAAMIAMLAAVPPHAAWVFWHERGDCTVQGYDTFALWAQTLFTALGFLGTIIGVSLAIAGLEAAMQADDPSQLILGLSTAFDTTFIGLSGAILLMGLRKVTLLWTVS